MSENVRNEQNPSHGMPPPAWIKAFLLLNIMALAGLFAWQLWSVARNPAGDRESQETQQREINAALARNPPPSSDTGQLSDVRTIAIDASNPRVWTHLHFATGSTFKSAYIAATFTEWDIAFNRATILTNGGATGKGGVTVAALENAKFNEVTETPLTGYIEDERAGGQTANPALSKWYAYNYWTHRLTPKPVVYVIRAANGNFAKFQIMSFYCGAAAGCYTIQYQYQGSGSRIFNR
ncbi:MAG: HmuY family protein [Nitrospinae bacterium]|nr:HmuY family protein [Nitrospinota bacterium]